MRKLFIVGNCYDKQCNGAANVIRNLIAGFENLNIDFETILVSEHFSKKQVISRVLKILLFEKNCVINVHTDGLILPFLVYLCSLLDSKNDYYITVHGSYLIESSFGRVPKKKYLFMEKIIYKNFRNMICVSEMQKKDLIFLYNRSKPTYVIPNATDAMNFAIAKAELNELPHLLMLGGIRSEKGIWKTLQLVDYLHKEKQVLAYLDIYGNVESDSLKQEYFERLKELHLDEYIQYKGMLSNKEQVYSIIENSDFQLCLSNYDSFNVAILESIVLGCPCLCTNKCGASSFVVDTNCGIVVDNEDDEWLEDAAMYIQRLIERPDVYRALSEKAIEIKDKVTWKAICEMYISQMNLR